MSSTLCINTQVKSNNRGISGGVIKYQCYYVYMKELSTELIPLTAEELKFASLVSKGYSGTTAYRMAFPLKKDKSYGYIRQLASELLTNPNIVTEVSTTIERQARLARLAEERIEDILINDDSSVKGSKVADVAMFMYDHANGKAMQRTQVEGKFVTVTYDLSGGKAGVVPQEILDQLADD